MTNVEVRGSARQAIWLMAIGGALTAVVLAGNLLGWWTLGEDALSDALTSIVPAVAFIGLGALIVWRTDAARIGWLLGAMGFSVMAAGVAGGIADMGYVAGEAIGGAFWLSWILAIGLLIIWFPTGQVVTPRWLWLQWCFFVVIAANFFVYTFSGEVCDVYSDEIEGCITWVRNPIGIQGVPNPEFGAISGPLFAIVGVLFVVAVMSLIVRLRRSSGVERQQLKWFLFAGSLVVLSFLLESVTTGLGFVPAPMGGRPRHRGNRLPAFVDDPRHLPLSPLRHRSDHLPHRDLRVGGGAIGRDCGLASDCDRNAIRQSAGGGCDDSRRRRAVQPVAASSATGGGPSFQPFSL